MKQLARTLQGLKVFEQAQVESEQYPTPANMAVDFLLFTDFTGKRVLDLGAGTGILGIGALLLGAKKVTFIEQDASAIPLLEENLQGIPGEHEILNRELLMTDVQADVAIMNPPFGTRKEHADREFLDYAMTHANELISIHKTNTLPMIRKHIQGFGWTVAGEENHKMQLKQTMAHHTRRIKEIEVTIVYAHSATYTE